jgi:hypothetical protein
LVDRTQPTDVTAHGGGILGALRALDHPLDVAEAQDVAHEQRVAGQA